MNRLAARFALLCALVVAVIAGCRPSSQSSARELGAAPSPVAPPPVFQVSWNQSAWYIDPAASVAGAADTNDCATALTPCKTWAGVIAKLGTYSPRWRSNVTVTFLSSHSDLSDPVYLEPRLENNAVVVVQGTLTQVATATLANVVAKNRSTGQLLTADLTTGLSAGMLVVNNTHASKAWTYVNTSGVTWKLSQPLAARTPPQTIIINGTDEVDTWANGDSVTIYSLPQIALVSFQPTVATTSAVVGGTSPSKSYLYQIGNVTPASTSEPLRLNGGVKVFESSLTRAVNWEQSIGHDTNTFGAWNTWFATALTFQPAKSIVCDVFGGVGPTNNAVVSNDCSYGGGFIARATIAGYGITQIGDVYVEASKAILAADSGTLFVVNLGEGAATVWGPGSVQTLRTGHISYPSGAGKAATTFLQTGAWSVNGGTTMCSHTGAQPDVINCGITISAANLDATAGTTGFGGNAFIPGGASITNF